jgi:transposase
MSMKPQTIGSIPQQTIETAKQAFPLGNTYMKMRDELGVFFSDEDFVDLFSSRGQPALSPWRLALVTIMQFAENLTDRQAADSVRSRIDWKYALGLELTDPGFHYSVLSEFRSRLVDKEGEHKLFEKMLARFNELGLLKARGCQRTDSTHVLANVRTLNRLQLVAQTMHQTLNVLAELAPSWLKAHVPTEWYDKYGRRIEEYRLPNDKAQREQLAIEIGQDGHRLFEWLDSPTAPPGLAIIDAVATMRQIWIQQYYHDGQAVHWRTAGNFPPASVTIPSPYDPDARAARKRQTNWIGYKIHLSETCDAEMPHLITNVSTTSATEPDHSTIPSIHNQLHEARRLPQTHIVDNGYLTGELLVNSKTEHQLDLFGPVSADTSWQAREEGAFDITCFAIDFESHQAICPMGHTSCYWKAISGARGQPKILVKFKHQDCIRCPARARCTRNKSQPRQLLVAPKEQHKALQEARNRQKSEPFAKVYAKRAGVEGTISAATDTFGMRRCRYRGHAKVHLQHLLTAAAMNLTQAVNWLMKVPRSKTKVSRFAALAA